MTQNTFGDGQVIKEGRERVVGLKGLKKYYFLVMLKSGGAFFCFWRLRCNNSRPAICTKYQEIFVNGYFFFFRFLFTSKLPRTLEQKGKVKEETNQKNKILRKKKKRRRTKVEKKEDEEEEVFCGPICSSSF